MTIGASVTISALSLAAFYVGKMMERSNSQRERSMYIMATRKYVFDQIKDKSLEEIEHMRMQAERFYARMAEDQKAKL